MNRPTLEVADIIRQHGKDFIENHRAHLSPQQHKVLRAIEHCRTAALGGHLDRCSCCDHCAISYNSCRNRHCPKCLTRARDRWLAAREKELLNVSYFHVVFTLPHQLAPLALQNKHEIYGLLFRASAETLLTVARDPRHLGAEIGFFSVLHTWNQQLLHHPHVHCVLPAGGLASDHSRWISAQYRFFLPVRVLSRVFRGKFVAGLRTLHAGGKLGFHGALAPLARAEAFAAMLRSLFRSDWVVYCKRPFRGANHVVQYLGRYTHRVAISNHRLISLVDGQVTFRWRDSAHHNQQSTMTLPAMEFLRRFLLHILPPGFVRIRHFGIFAHRRRRVLLPLCFRLLARSGKLAQKNKEDAKAPLWTCPKCNGPMIVIERLSALQARLRSPPISISAHL